MENLALLAGHHAPITLRCVLVPGCNINDDHFRAIAAISKKYPSIRGVEIMAYHGLWFRKIQANRKTDVPH